MASVVIGGVVTSMNVLIVDDEALLRWAIAQTLLAAGCTVVETSSIQSATEAITHAARPFDVILFDCHLPDCPGLRFLTRARQISSSSRVIVLTADKTPDLEAAARRLGAIEVLPKPVDLDVVRAAIMNATQVSRLVH